MGSKRNTDTDVQPTSSQVTHSRARSRSGLLAFLRPRQTVSPGAQNAPPDQATASRVNTLSPSNVQPDTNCTPVFDSDWSNLPDHLIESILHVLQSSESDPLHPSNKPARLVRAQLPSACLAYCSSVSSAHNSLLLQSLFAATSVSRNWRHIGKRAFFQNLWDEPGCIRHPVQLLGLVRL